MNEHPNRPDHEDFWLMSRLVIDNDYRCDELGETALKEIVEEQIDTSSLTYMAQQRAYRLLDILTTGDLLGREDEVIAMSATWVDAFIVGAQYAKEKGNK